MKRCLYSGRLHRPGRLPSFPYPPAILCRLTGFFRSHTLNRRTSPDQQRHYSAAHSSVPPHALPLRHYVLAPLPKVPIPVWERASVRPWVKLLDKYLPPELRVFPGTPDGHVAGGDILAQGRDLLHTLFYARREEKSPLPFMGFTEERWPAVYALLSLLLDAADSVRHERVPRQALSNLDWGSAHGLSLSQLTYPNPSSDDPMRVQAQVNRNSTGPVDLSILTNRPYANELSNMLVGQVFLSLGEIILYTADRSPEESRRAMSYVFRILARLHHSDFIPDRVYRYMPPDNNDTAFRPPGMHLLSTHIMRILSDAAWADHEAEIAKGGGSPFVPFKMGGRELGPEIWLEFVLWCCVENGFTEAMTLLTRMFGRFDTSTWRTQSWKPLLQDPESLWKTNIDSEEFWHRSGNQHNESSSVPSVPATFHGLGKRTISSEVIYSIIESMLNHSYNGTAWGGMPARSILGFAKFVRRVITEGSKSELQPTTKSVNSFAVRFLESGGINPHLDPHTLYRLIATHPNVVPPWEGNQVDIKELERISQSQIHNETSAFMGLLEYTIQIYAGQVKTDLAMKTFGSLLLVTDESKRQRIIKSFELLSRPESGDISTFNANYPTAQQAPNSSLPQVTNVTLAVLLDAARSSRNFELAEWLLYSDDIDGPVIPPSAYGDQVLAPALLRYAMETNNRKLHDQVIQSLVQPFSLNTLRVLLNTKIAMGDWGKVVELLSYIRNHRAKSWGFSTLATLTATILRLDHSIRHSLNTGRAPRPETRESLNRAKDILLRMLNGEFNTPSHVKSDNYNNLVIQGFCRLLWSISGPFVEIVKQVRRRDFHMREVLPILPTEPFNELLSVVVEIYGSAAGKFLWTKWLIDLPTLYSRRLHQGGVRRLYLRDERNKMQGNPVFNSQWFNRLQTKMIHPNLNTVRIISAKAVEESIAESKAPGSVIRKYKDSEEFMIPNWESPRKVLDFCVLRYKNLHASDKLINLQTNGHLTRMLRSRKLFRVPRRRRKAVRLGYSPKWAA